jgi:hypothetical protein
VNLFPSNAIFGLFSYRSLDPFIFNLVAVTNPIHLSAVQTYDNIPFTTSPVVAPGTYWMMALYESVATPRRSFSAEGTQIAFWISPYAAGMPDGVSFQSGDLDPIRGDFLSDDYNYWVNGQRTSAVPEPGRVTAVGLAALALLLRASRRTQIFSTWSTWRPWTKPQKTLACWTRFRQHQRSLSSNRNRVRQTGSRQ